MSFEEAFASEISWGGSVCLRLHISVAALDKDYDFVFSNMFLSVLSFFVCFLFLSKEL